MMDTNLYDTNWLVIRYWDDDDSHDTIGKLVGVFPSHDSATVWANRHTDRDYLIVERSAAGNYRFEG